MKLKQLLAISTDYHFRLHCIKSDKLFYADDRDSYLRLLNEYGNSTIKSFCAYALDEFDGFLHIRIDN